MPPQKASKSQPKADASERAKSKDRDWLTTAELATKIGWREHALRDALRGKELPGVRRTSFGYHVEASAVGEIAKILGAPPPKGNSPRREVRGPGGAAAQAAGAPARGADAERPRTA